MIEIFGERTAEVSNHLDIGTRIFLDSNPTSFISCPKCEEYLEVASPGVPESCVCPSCNHQPFCSCCKELYHGICARVLFEQVGAGHDAILLGLSAMVGGVTCEEAAETVRRWTAWRNGGRRDFVRKVVYIHNERQHTESTH
jgi:hypothetical protein